jgi:ribosomal protein L22
MSILLDKKELKKAAKEISVAKIHEAIEVLQSAISDRQKEIDTIEQIKQLAKSQGFSLEQLGLSVAANVVVEAVEQPSEVSTRPTKPKFKTLNPDSQFFYVENGKLNLLKTHTMKKGLEERGIQVVPFINVDQKFQHEISQLIEEAVAQATTSFNAKVEIWNAWAEQNGEDILATRG